MALTQAFSFWCKRMAPPRVCLEGSKNTLPGGVWYSQGNKTRSRPSTSEDPTRGTRRSVSPLQISRIETFRCVIHPHPEDRGYQRRQEVDILWQYFWR